MKDARQITPAEFQIMEALWRRGAEMSVREVLQVVRRERKVAYTTVMTLLGKLADKGSVARRRRGKAYLYKPAVGREEAIGFLIQEFVDAYCGGDRGALRSRVGKDPAKAPPPTPTTPAPVEEPEMDVSLL